jgi:hypothetical protein
MVLHSAPSCCLRTDCAPSRRPQHRLDRYSTPTPTAILNILTYNTLAVKSGWQLCSGWGSSWTCNILQYDAILYGPRNFAGHEPIGSSNLDQLIVMISKLGHLAPRIPIGLESTTLNIRSHPVCMDIRIMALTSA